jgi:hypothetical protein
VWLRRLSRRQLALCVPWAALACVVWQQVVGPRRQTGRLPLLEVALIFDRVEIGEGAVGVQLVAWSGDGWTICSALALDDPSGAGFLVQGPGGEETWNDLVLSEAVLGSVSCGGHWVAYCCGGEEVCVSSEEVHVLLTCWQSVSVARSFWCGRSAWLEEFGLGMAVSLVVDVLLG